jgi:DNA-binding transcriptional LysR family regulator
MELRHLRYFAAVAGTRHFGKAAQQLHMAQPPLSQAIRQLEAEMGVALFTRTTRQVALTPAGESFLVDVQRILESLEAGIHRARRIHGGKTGVLRVAFTGAASYRALPRIAQLVKRQLPDVGLEIHTDMLTPAQETGLLESRIDLGVLRPPVSEESIRTRTIASEGLVLVLPSDHRLAAGGHLEMADLRPEPFILYEAAGSVVNDAVVRSCLAAGFSPKVQHEAVGTSALLALVAAGLGVAFVPESVRAASLEGVTFREVEGAETVELALAWRADDSSALLHELLATLDGADLFPDAAGSAADADTAALPRNEVL